MAVLLYGALMRRRVAGERLDVLSGVAERGVQVVMHVMPGVGVGASTGCVRIVVAGPNSPSWAYLLRTTF